MYVIIKMNQKNKAALLKIFAKIWESDWHKLQGSLGAGGEFVDSDIDFANFAVES